MTTTQDKLRTNLEKTFFASIGAPFIAAEKSIEFVKSTGEHLKTRRSELKDVHVAERAEELKGKAFEELTAAIDAWAAKGEELLTGLKEQNATLVAQCRTLSGREMSRSEPRDANAAHSKRERSERAKCAEREESACV